MNEIKSKAIKTGTQLVAVRMIKEKHKNNSFFEQGKMALIHVDDISSMTGLSESEILDIAKWCESFNRMQVAKEFADGFCEDSLYDFNDEERVYIQCVVYKLFDFFLETANDDDVDYSSVNRYKDEIFSWIGFAFEVNKIRDHVKQISTLEDIHYDFLKYVALLIERAVDIFDWQVVKLMGDFKLDEPAVEKLIKKHGGYERHRLSACIGCDEYLGLQLMYCGPILKVRCPNCARGASGGNWDEIIEKWNHMNDINADDTVSKWV